MRPSRLVALAALALCAGPTASQAWERQRPVIIDDRIVGIPGGVLAPPEYDRAVPVERVDYPRPYIARGRLYNIPPDAYAVGHGGVVSAKY